MKTSLVFCLVLLAIVSAVNRKIHDKAFKQKTALLRNTRSSVHTEKHRVGDPCSESNDWKELGTFRPADSMIHGFFGSTLGTIRYQRITEGWGDVNLDLYEVEITTLPKTYPSGKELFEFWRRDLAKGDATQMVDINQCSFKAFDDGEGTRWGSDNPKTTYITIHLARLISSITSFSFDDGSVMCTEFDSTEEGGHWIFSVIESFRDGGHPVSGNRRFGWYKKDGKTIFYTKGVDRVTTWMDRIASAAGQVFENADLTWVSMQDKLVEYVNANGGDARKLDKISVRCPWDSIWSEWTEPCDSRGVIEVEGASCHTTNVISCDGGHDDTCESDKDDDGNPTCVEPGHCVCGTVQCYCGRPPAQGKICDPWKK